MCGLKAELVCFGRVKIESVRIIGTVSSGKIRGGNWLQVVSQWQRYAHVQTMLDSKGTLLYNSLHYTYSEH